MRGAGGRARGARPRGPGAGLLHGHNIKHNKHNHNNDKISNNNDNNSSSNNNIKPATSLLLVL